MVGETVHMGFVLQDALDTSLQFHTLEGKRHVQPADNADMDT